MSHPRDLYVELAAKVDRMFASIQERYGDAMQCGSGCTDCCQVRFSVTLIEAAHIVAGLAQLPNEIQTVLAERAEHGPVDVCAALDRDGRCQIYPWRPLVCRSHGAPIRNAPAVSLRSGNPAVETPNLSPSHAAEGANASVDSRDSADRGHKSADPVRLPVVHACSNNFAGGRGLGNVEAGFVFDQATLSTVLGAIDAAFADACGIARGTRIDLAAVLRGDQGFWADID